MVGWWGKSIDRSIDAKMKRRPEDVFLLRARIGISNRRLSLKPRADPLQPQSTEEATDPTNSQGNSWVSSGTTSDETSSDTTINPGWGGIREA
jgi:hypothetical protein